ncbi:MAG: hypothetical protein IAE99_06455 [Rhodothermales bacterium]|nr:hypothetical protein [Rhodothermales bacterium]MCA0269887.1 hypothetical protein [Bacteroidota bacterium]
MDDRFDRLDAGLRQMLHDARGSLAVIAGNAQLLAEVAPSYDFDDLVKTSIADLAEASQDLAAALRALSDLRGTLAPHA